MIIRYRKPCDASEPRLETGLQHRTPQIRARVEHVLGRPKTHTIFPGYHHDTLAGFPLFFVGSPVWNDLGDDLVARGVEMPNTDLPSATVTHDGRTALLHRDIARTAAGLSPTDGEASTAMFDEFFKVGPAIGALQSAELHLGHAAGPALALLAQGVPVDEDLQQLLLLSARQLFSGPEVPGLIGPWVNHTGQTLDQAGSAAGALGFTAVIHGAGIPVVAGGIARLVDALVALIIDHGGTVSTGRHVERVLVRGGRAVGVRIADGEEFEARHAVTASTIPNQLYDNLLPDGAVPESTVQRTRRYAYGRSNTQIHLGLTEPLQWRSADLAESLIVNVTEGLDAQSVHNGETQAGLLPRDPTFTVGTPTLLDPGRGAEGWQRGVDSTTRDPGTATR